jgi:hypothetical protein
MPVAFAGSGYLVTYYSGVSGVLQERGVIAPGVTPLAGASGGAVTAVLSGLGMSGGAQQEFFAGMVRGRLGGAGGKGRGPGEEGQGCCRACRRGAEPRGPRSAAAR